MHRHFKLVRLAFGSILSEGLPYCEHLLDIDAEVQKLRQFSFLRRAENSGFVARAIKAATPDGISKIDLLHEVSPTGAV